MALLLGTGLILFACSPSNSENGSIAESSLGPRSTTTAPTTADAPTPTTSHSTTTLQETTTSSAAVVTTGSETTAITESSPLKRRDVPPEGSLAQFEWYEEGNGPCEGFGTPNVPMVRFHLYPDPLIQSDSHTESSVVSIGRFMYMCVLGFGDITPVLHIQDPDGTVHTRQDGGGYGWFSPGNAGVAWRALPGDPLGDYLITATGDGSVAEAVLSVVPASEPGIVVMEPTEPGIPPGLAGYAYGPAGTTFTFAIFGFPPEQTVPVYLYFEETSGNHVYLTELRAVQVSAAGTAYFDVVTRVDDPTGHYCVQIEPSLPICQGRFSISEPS